MGEARGGEGGEVRGVVEGGGVQAGRESVGDGDCWRVVSRSLYMTRAKTDGPATRRLKATLTSHESRRTFTATSTPTSPTINT